jgi:hypothetical protein
MKKCLIQINYCHWEIRLFLSLVIATFVVVFAGCFHYKYNNETIPAKFEAEHFYGSGGFIGGSPFRYIKIYKDNKISQVEYISVFTASNPISRTRVTEMIMNSTRLTKEQKAEGLERCRPKYKKRVLSDDDFRSFWKEFNKLALISLPDEIDRMESYSDEIVICPTYPGVFKFSFALNGEIINKQISIGDDPCEWFNELKPHSLASAMQLVFEQTRLATEEFNDKDATEIIKIRLLDIYHKYNLKDKRLSDDVINALIFLEAEIPSNTKTEKIKESDKPNDLHNNK